MLMLVILIAAQVDFIVGSILGPVDELEKAKGFVGYNSKSLSLSKNSYIRQKAFLKLKLKT
jgi:hypothetical protein